MAARKPELELRFFDHAGQLVEQNRAWKNGAAVRATASAVGAFALADGSKDASLVATLSAGAYTAVVTGGPGSSGIALVEVYELP